ncbi:MAG: membrane protein [Nitrospinaceae bacterium]|nr:MAG: membrane protein [Nitrospinaceae bacterium]
MKKLRKAIKKNIIAGLLVTVPAALTYLVLAFVIRNVDRAMDPVITRVFGPTGLKWMQEYHIPGTGFVLLVLFIVMVGLFGTNFFGKMILDLSERVLNNIPFVRVIYTSIKKVVNTLSETETPSFQNMVLLTYPRPPLKALGIVCGDTKGDINQKTHDESINVFVPTSPNPTTGFLLMVPKKDLVFLEMSVEEGLKMIISFGMVSSGPNKEPVEAKDKTGEGG